MSLFTEKAPISHDDLVRLLDYEPNTGLFRWKTKISRKAVVGELAGCHRADGYVVIKLNGTRYRAHRLAWLYMTGQWPTEFVDHRDGDRSNNRWANLRLANRSENMWNMVGHSDSRTGLKGVTRDDRRWIAQIAANGSSHWLGSFKTAADAQSAYAAAAIRYHRDFARVSP